MAVGEGYDYSRVSSEVQDELEQLAGVISQGERKQTCSGVVIGEALLTARGHLRHGEFGKWCRVVLGYKQRKAQLYMNAALLFRQHGEDVCRLPLTAAQDLGAASVSPDLVDEVLARVRRGERVTVEWVKQKIRSSRGGRPGTESASDHSRVMAVMITEALGVRLCQLLHAFIEERPSTRLFMADLAESAAAKIRRGPAARATPVTLSLTAN